MSVSIRTAYRQLVSSGQITADAGQASAVEAFARLEADLNALSEPWLSFLGKPKAPKGLYLYGPPGRGKSMLMDLFFASAPVKFKKRLHFHAFMARVHALIREWREGDERVRKALFGQFKGDDPILPVAKVIADEARLLCFDELQVTDIADAMILGRLFEALFALSVTLVATSNRIPQDLYKNGLNRQLFLPFIDMLQDRCDVVSVAGPKDFRLDRLVGAEVNFHPLTPANQSAFDSLWQDMTALSQETGAVLEVLGRKLEFPRAVGPLLRVRFEDLCDRPLGPQDYLAIAERFNTLFLEDVPRLKPTRRDQAKRFVTLIDALYEAGSKLVMLAESAPEDLYPEGDGAFEFERTVSRLNEMRSKDYLERTPKD